MSNKMMKIKNFQHRGNYQISNVQEASASKHAENRRFSSKAISEIISTVLLIVMAIAMAGAVYSWMTFYVQKPLPVESCPDGVSLTIEQYNCTGNNITITVQNRGLFDITGFSAKFNNETGNETSPEIAGKYSLNIKGMNSNIVVFSKNLSSGDKTTAEFTFAGYNQIAQIELEPFRGYDNYSRPNFCDKAVIRQSISNCIGVPGEAPPTNPPNPPTPPAGCPDGMIGYWKGDNDAKDSYDANDGTIEGNVNYVSGKVGQAFNFIGDGSSVSLGNLPSTPSFTLTAWVYPKSFAGMGGIIGTVGGAYRMIRTNSDRKLDAGFSNGSGYPEIIGPVLSIEQWQHIAFTYDGAQMCIYKDGVPTCKAETSPIESGTSAQYLGIEAIAGRAWNGLIDEAAIFNKALSLTEIQNLYNSGIGKDYCSAAPPTPSAVCGIGGCETGEDCLNCQSDCGKCANGHSCTSDSQCISNSCNNGNCAAPIPTNCPSGMVSYWKFDEGSGTTAVDSIGGKDGIIYGATRVSGKIGNALSFDGTTDSNVAIGYNYPGVINGTILVWVYPFSFPSQRGIVSMGQKPHIFSGSGGALGYDAGSGAITTYPNYPLSLNAWQHVAFAWNSSTGIIYVNGAQKKSGPFSISTRTGSTSIGRPMLGPGYEFGWVFDGMIDEVAIFNRTLTQSEITGYYNSGAYC